MFDSRRSPQNADVVVDNLEAGPSRVALALLLFVAVFLTYARVAHFSFLNLDDDQYVVDNPFVSGGAFWPNIVAAFTHVRVGHFHPLTWISHLIDCRLFGLDAGAHHLMNVLFHAISSALLFLLFTRVVFVGRPLVAFFAAAIFALHPMRLESVAWVSERKDVLSVMWTLLLLHAYVSYRKAPSPLRYALIVFLFALGLLSKPTILILPALLLLLDYWPLGVITSLCTARTRVLEKIPLFVLSLASLVTTIVSQHVDGALVSRPGLPLGDSLANAAISYLAWAGKFLWPAHLGIFYPLASHAPGVGVGAMLGLFALGFVFLRSKKKPLIVGWLWFVIAGLPMCGLVQFGGQAFADRWSYLPHIGLIIAAVSWLSERLSESTLTRLLAVTLCALVGKTSLELGHWRDSESIFSHTLTIAPDNFMAHTNLGSALDTAGRLDEAAPHYEEAARLNPTYPEALNNLGTLRARQHRLAESLDLFARAIAIRPGFTRARYNLGLSRSNLGDSLGAATDWLSVLELDPSYEAARQSLRFVALHGLSRSCEELRRDPAVDFARTFDRTQSIVRDASVTQALLRVRDCLR